VAFAKVRAWSRSEGHAEGYIVFLAELRRRRTAHRPGKKKHVRVSPKRWLSGCRGPSDWSRPQKLGPDHLPSSCHQSCPPNCLRKVATFARRRS